MDPLGTAACSGCPLPSPNSWLGKVLDLASAGLCDGRGLVDFEASDELTVSVYRVEAPDSEVTWAGVLTTTRNGQVLDRQIQYTFDPVVAESWEQAAGKCRRGVCLT